MVRTIAEVEDQIKEVREALDLLRQEGKKQALEHQHQQELLATKLFESKRNFARFQRTSSVRLHTYTTAIETAREEEGEAAGGRGRRQEGRGGQERGRDHGAAEQREHPGGARDAL